MKRLFNFEAGTFDAHSELAEELGLFDTELAEELEWEGTPQRRVYPLGTGIFEQDPGICAW